MVRPQIVGLLALLGLLPVAYYLTGTGQSIVAFSLVCVLLIAGSLYWMFQPRSGQAHGQ
ncbi:MAG: hypothetical protein ABEH35_08665 [Haloarculaceae archaeon]